MFFVKFMLNMSFFKYKKGGTLFFIDDGKMTNPTKKATEKITLKMTKMRGLRVGIE